MTAALLAGCTGSVTQPTSKYFTDTKTISLQSGEFPSYLAFGAHDTLWVTENGGNVIGRFDAVGELTQYPIQVGTNNDPQDIINGPGGSIWFTGLAEIGRIDPDGILKVWNTATIGAEVGLPDALAVGPDGAVWYTDDSGHICRIASSGKTSCYATHPSTRDILMNGLALGPDGALWFTEDNPGSAADTQNAIGRLTAGGQYRRWPLPPGASPTRIAAGSDGALWFTERTGQRIGRITTSGTITQFSLPRGIYPSDIISGPGKALWFSADTRVGRITTAGQITLWSLAGAQQFGGITVAPDGSLWLADGLANTIRHFIPPS
jgi:virginiamycin B lyase